MNSAKHGAGTHLGQQFNGHDLKLVTLLITQPEEKIMLFLLTDDMTRAYYINKIADKRAFGTENRPDRDIVWPNKYD
jgi:hypothetical protein